MHWTWNLQIGTQAIFFSWEFTSFDGFAHKSSFLTEICKKSGIVCYREKKWTVKNAEKCRIKVPYWFGISEWKTERKSGQFWSDDFTEMKVPLKNEQQTSFSSERNFVCCNFAQSKHIHVLTMFRRANALEIETQPYL